jgi:hypothetical protein
VSECVWCGYSEDVHDHEHIARECSPKRIAQLEAQVATLREALEQARALAEEAWQAVDCGNVEQHPGLPEIARVQDALDAALAESQGR